ncbi:MAG: C-terminal binding protein [Haloechinothrix sp.]
MSKPTPAALYLAMDGLDVDPGKALLREAGLDVLDITKDSLDAGDLARVVALLVGYDKAGDDWFDQLPALRVVSTHSAGVDMVDVAAAHRRGLRVAHLAGGATSEVATHALAMALALIRRLPMLDTAVRRGRWKPDDADLPGSPRTLTCGVVGMGRIGQAFASLAAGVFASVIGYDPALPEELWPTDVERLALPDLLARSDCASLHLALTDETRGIIDADALASMPVGSVLVNVARGELVDEAALVGALRSGHLAGAACDVLTQEPPRKDHPLLVSERVLLSPHAAYLSPSSMQVYATEPARSVVALLAGAELPNIIRSTPPRPGGRSVP